MPRTIMMFPGQGSQYYQMGRELHAQDAAYRRAMDRCDAICRDLGARAPSAVIAARPLADSEHFDDLAESNAALIAVGYALAAALDARGVVADRLLGYSLGETIAAVVAGALPLEDGFRLVLGQARIMAAHAPPGAMLAVIGDPAALGRRPDLAPLYEVAGINVPTHRVLSVLARDVPAVMAGLEALSLTVARLPIRYPFHAAAIEAAGPALRDFVAGFRFAPPRLPILSAATCAPVTQYDAAHLWQVARAPTRFADLIRALADEGPWALIEAGPSGTLASFARLIGAPGITAHRSIDQFGQNMRSMQQLSAVFA